ncbi:hypothetical protein [Cellulophaga sp. BC115SP]|uniref:hypothetical protein n=1 Tax=Cellulophaga sp. BC115SP TaxID=2683263 RepID=UPI0014129236|nr:hypothetical protein [Cellulophaga sp. BC115SP]NBB31838.1 hypothetical protein [Cellulophaga sp. BC115SP]
MTYYETKKLSDIYSFEILNGEIISMNKNNTISLRNINEKLWEIKAGGGLGFLQILQDIVIFQSNNGSLKIISIKNGNLLYENFANLFRLPVTNNKIVTYKLNVDTIKKEYGVFDLTLKTIIWRNKNYDNLSYINQCLFSIGIKSISKVNSSNGYLVWNIEFTNSDKFLNILNVSDNHLWLITQREENYWFYFDLIAINAQTGEVEKQLDYKAFFGYTAQFIEEKQSIISLRGNFREDRGTHFLEIDARNGEIIRQQTLDQLKSIGLNVFEFTLNKNYIYFTATSKDDAIFAKSIGVLSYETLELLWWEEVNLENGAFFAAGQKPVISDNRIFILDTGGTLHIYEREAE